MKNQLQVLITQLQDFLTNIQAIAKHPYSLGIDVNKMITDVLAHVGDMEQIINSLPNDEEEKSDQ